MGETTQTTGHGGRRSGAGRPISSIDTIIRRLLPDDLARELVFELRIAAERLSHADPNAQAEMFRAMIAGIRQATTEGAQKNPGNQMSA